MRGIELPAAAQGGDHWLTMDGSRLHALAEDTRRLLCRDWSERHLRLRHLMMLVLFHQFEGVRDAVRVAALSPDAAAAGMRSDFGLGYLSGLVADYAETCGLPADGGIASAARLDLHLFTFGLVEGQALLATRDHVMQGDGFARGQVMAEWDVETYKAWLEGADDDPAQGLRDGLMRIAAAPGGLAKAAWVGWA
ncbi:hypothetical protein [Falsiroseomonas sp. HW251]|uniref:hypothetical protein n=1 Tax=Falsiroseomonas sp. HW251 TaxID=3390998 RepID=UPI003D315CF1